MVNLSPRHAALTTTPKASLLLLATKRETCIFSPGTLQTFIYGRSDITGPLRLLASCVRNLGMRSASNEQVQERSPLVLVGAGVVCIRCEEVKKRNS